MPFTTKDWRDAPGDLTTPISAAAMEDLETRLSAYADAVAAAVPAVIPPAVVQWTAAPGAPTGWLVANGTTVSRTTYAALYAALGGAASPYGQGNGSTTFTLPDLRDRAPVGSGTTYAVGAAGGAATVTLTAAQMPSHTHTGPSHTHTGPSHTHTGAAHTHTVPAHTHVLDYQNMTINTVGSGTTFAAQQPNAGTAYNTRSSGATTSGSTASGATSASGTGATGASGTAATGAAGTDGSHANLPPYLALLPIIKT